MKKYSVKRRKIKTQENKRGLTLKYPSQKTEYSIYHSEYGYVADIRDTCPDSKQMAQMIVNLLNSNTKYKLPSELTPKEKEIYRKLRRIKKLEEE